MSKSQESDGKNEIEEEEVEEVVFEDELSKRLSGIKVGSEGESFSVCPPSQMDSASEKAFIQHHLLYPPTQHIQYLLSNHWIQQWTTHIHNQIEVRGGVGGGLAGGVGGGVGGVGGGAPQLSPFNEDLLLLEDQDEPCQTNIYQHSYNYQSSSQPQANSNEKHKLLQMNTKFLGDILNRYLQPQVSDKDFSLVSADLMEYLGQHYKGHIIARQMDHTGHIDVFYKKANLVIVTNQMLRNIDQNKQMSLKVYQCQYKKGDTLQSLLLRSKWFIKDNYKKVMNQFYMYTQVQNVSDDQMRLWRLSPEEKLDDFFRQLQKETKANVSFNYSLKMKGTYLGDNLTQPVLTHDLDNNLITYVIDLRETKSDWNLVQKGLDTLNRCDNCKDYFKKDMIKCMCLDVQYCAKKCQQMDKVYHQMRCDSAGQETEEMDEQGHFLQKAEAKNGLVGLMNLGNTCYMNSALQCLSNTQPLTMHFLQRKYVDEINLDNPLGSQGKLAEKYAQLVRNLHYESNSSFNPFAIKNAVGNLNQHFQGYGQQDSSEFLQYILDGLHEDINRVKQKPFTEMIEGNGQEDDKVVAQKSWDNYQKRNQSVIIDNFYGQFKSELHCPVCNKISITFDPFAMVSLPIPSQKRKDLDFFYIHADNKIKPYRIKIDYNPNKDTVQNIKQKLDSMLGKANPVNFLTLSYTEAGNVIDDLSIMADVLRKKVQSKNLFAIEYLNEPEQPAEIVFQMNQYQTTLYNYQKKDKSQNKKQFTFTRLFRLDKRVTLKSILLEILRFNRCFFDEQGYYSLTAEQCQQMTDECLYSRIFQEQVPDCPPDYIPYEVRYLNRHSPLNTHLTCEVCQQGKCQMNCELIYNDQLDLKSITSIQKRFQEKQPTWNSTETTPIDRLELEIIWSAELPTKDYDLSRLNNCQTFKETGSKSEVKDKEGQIDIYKCLQHFEMSETLGEDNAWYCGQCKKHQKANKKMQIYKAPQILICHLKRFKYNQSQIGYNSYGNSVGKIGQYIHCPQVLDMTHHVINKDLPNQISQQMSEDDDNNNQLLYELYAISNHYGNAGGGHYTAYSKTSNDNQWHEFDDSRVTLQDKDSVVTEAAYFLFYRRKS